jgi:hypothetical protein
MARVNFARSHDDHPAIAGMDTTQPYPASEPPARSPVVARSAMGGGGDAHDRAQADVEGTLRT